MPDNAEAESPAEKDKPPAATAGAGTEPETSDKAVRKGTVELDDFGLPVRQPKPPLQVDSSSSDEEYNSAPEDAPADEEAAASDRQSGPDKPTKIELGTTAEVVEATEDGTTPEATEPTVPPKDLEQETAPVLSPEAPAVKDTVEKSSPRASREDPKGHRQNKSVSERSRAESLVLPKHLDAPIPLQGASEWSHQQVVPQNVGVDEDTRPEEEWKEMPAFAPFNLYNDDGKLIAREAEDSDEEAADGGLGGASKGYTRVNMDEDAQSATSMDDNTKYLFKEAKGTNLDEEDEEARDPLAQLQATKDLLTEQQRIAYVGVTRVAMSGMVKEMDAMEGNKGTKKEIRVATESLKMWSQKMIVRLYAHMEISSAEQIMIEQLAEHGVEAADLTPTLMQNSRVKNPMADKESSGSAPTSADPDVAREEKPALGSAGSSPTVEESGQSPAPPPYEEHEGEEMPEVRTPSQLPTTQKIDIDLRWTVLCDLFLVLIADSVYDSRSRVLLERVGAFLDVPWLEICRFEKRVTDALEMQEAANKENWNEDEHLENRRKMAVKRRMVMMGLATVGGSLVIGLSAGLLAPVIGAGLAAGFTTIGVAGTGGFLAGAGGAAVITTIGVTTGGAIAVKSTARRMGSVKTFEYRPLQNNKRVNLILTVAGWMNGKVDDVRLPYSTVDPIMGDIYSLLWEPEMLQSMGQTINILATEALTQGLQQVLGSTILVALMASLQLPIVLTKLSYLIDNPWTVSLDRANSAGQILADSLIDRNLGVRPVTLVGFSLGARLIYSCLKELASRGAVGIVQNVYLFGSPIVAKKDEWMRARTVISGRFVNGYAKNDWILGYLFRATSGGIMRVAGLAPVEGIPGLENVDVTELVNGHMAYRAAMPRLLREVGWEVESDDFVEIEDPDPDNHQERHREIIAEIDDARKELESKPKKRTFGFFGLGKKAQEKKEWETYDEGRADGEDGREGEDRRNSNVLFDIQAIRAELASEQMQVKQLESTLPPMKLELKQLESTLPPMKLNLSEGSGEPTASAHSDLRASKSHDAGTPTQIKDAAVPRPSIASENKAVGGRDHTPENTPERHLTPQINGASERVASDASSRAPATPLTADALQAHTHASTKDLPHVPRPELRTSVSMPASGAVDLDHNAWLDEEAGLENEREVTMSFE